MSHIREMYSGASCRVSANKSLHATGEQADRCCHKEPQCRSGFPRESESPGEHHCPVCSERKRDHPTCHPFTISFWCLECSTDIGRLRLLAQHTTDGNFCLIVCRLEVQARASRRVSFSRVLSAWLADGHFLAMSFLCA